MILSTAKTLFINVFGSIINRLFNTKGEIKRNFIMNIKYKNIVVAKSMYLFKSIDDNLIVTNKWKTTGLIKILYLNLELKSTEIYKNNKLIEFRSDTLKKKTKTKITVINDGKDLILNGPYGSINTLTTI